MTLDYFSLCQSGQAGCQAAPDAACARGLDRHANLRHVPAAWRASFAGMPEHIGTWGQCLADTLTLFQPRRAD